LLQLKKLTVHHTQLFKLLKLLLERAQHTVQLQTLEEQLQVAQLSVQWQINHQHILQVHFVSKLLLIFILICLDHLNRSPMINPASAYQITSPGGIERTPGAMSSA
jgi:hypothetical protein